MTIFITELQVLSICLGIAMAIVSFLLIAFFLMKHLKRKRINTNEKSNDKNEVIIQSEIIDYFGNKGNIKSFEKKGSRLIIEVYDVNKILMESIKKYGIDRILVGSNKITLIGEGVDVILQILQSI